MLGALGGFLSGAANIGNTYLSYKNYNEQKKQNAINQQNFMTTMAREDTSVQRRAADLKAAGLSQTLAAGGSASTASAPILSAPQMAPVQDPSEPIQKALALITQEKQIDQTLAQTDLAKSQKLKADADAYDATQAGKIKKHDYDIYKESGLPSNASYAGKIFQDASQIIKDPIKKLEGKINEQSKIKSMHRLNEMRQNKKSGFVGTQG